MAKIEVILGDNGQGKTRHLLNYFSENIRKKHFAIISNSIINPFPFVKNNNPHYYRLRSRKGLREELLPRSINDYFVSLIRDNSLRGLLNICKMIGYSDEIVVRREALYRIRKVDEKYHPYISHELLFSPSGRERHKHISSFRKPLTNGIVEKYGHYIEMSRDFRLGYNDHKGPTQSLFDHLEMDDEIRGNLGMHFYRPLFENRVYVRKENEFFLLECASSGELYLLSSGLFLNKFLEDNQTKLPKVILIDEPENSLHPKWQKKYIEYLIGFMGYNDKTKVIIATHSPFITMDTDFYSTEISLFHIENGFLHKADHKNKNNNIEQVYYELFGVLTPKNRYLSDYCSNLVRGVAERKVGYEVAHSDISAKRNVAFDDRQREFLNDVLKLLAKVHGDLNG